MDAGEQAILTYCRSHEAWVRDTIAALVRLESPSTDKAAVDACGAAIADRLAALGGRVQRVPQSVRGDHVRAEFFRDESGAAAPVLLLGHFDTVWPVGQIARMPYREEDGRLHGPGIFDMKAGIAIAMLAVRAIRDLALPGAPPVVMLWTTDEEIGSESSRALIEAEARASRAVLVLEPSLPGGAAKTSRQGVGQFEIIVRGIAAHAGIDPRQGASAIHELAHQIVAIEALQDHARGLTLNVGVISGGSRPNVVAEEARATIDVRVATMADGERIEAALRGLRPRNRRTGIEVTGGVERPPLERRDHVVRVYDVAREAAATLGLALGEGRTGGASDGNFTAALGVPTLDGLGPAGDGAHAQHEYVLVEDLGVRAAMLTALLLRLGAVKW